MLTDKVVCPKCGSPQIGEIDCYDIYTCNEGVRVCYFGTCKDCGEEMQWDEVYQFIGYDLEVV